VIRVDGALMPLAELKRLMQEDTIAMAFSIMNARQKQRFKEEFEIDIAYSVPGLGRFRCNIFQQRGTVGLVLRVIPARIMTVRELMLPPVLEKICEEPRPGAVHRHHRLGQVDHPGGDDRPHQRRRTEHIITIEDPIEFLHRDKKAIVNQREIDSDTRDFATALRSALRQDPDVILVGEMRDYETIETAILAAETGHLVFSTLHTLDATETINRIIAVFPPHHQKQIRIQLGQVLKAVVSLRLVPRADGMGRVPAAEVMRVTPYIRECIENKDKTKYIREQIALGTSQYGMQTFDQSLFSLYKTGLITLEEALRAPPTPTSSSSRSRACSSPPTPPARRWRGRWRAAATPSSSRARSRSSGEISPRRRRQDGRGRGAAHRLLRQGGRAAVGAHPLPGRAGREAPTPRLRARGGGGRARPPGRPGYLDDGRAAAEYVRLQRERRGWGRARLAAELGRRGAARQVIDEALAAIDGEADLELARAEVERSLARGEEPARVARRLGRKGLPTRAILAALGEAGGAGLDD
jgi:twitching motility protein PilT